MYWNSNMGHAKYIIEAFSIAWHVYKYLIQIYSFIYVYTYIS